MVLRNTYSVLKIEKWKRNAESVSVHGSTPMGRIVSVDILCLLSPEQLGHPHQFLNLKFHSQ